MRQRRDNQDRDFMAMALDMARLGWGRTSPNPMVGAVIVKDGKVLATGFHRRAGWPHAEVEALGKISKAKIRGATLYVTLEPCCHHGRTPPCTDAIVKSAIKKVVIGMRDPDPRVSGRGVRILKKKGIRVCVGVLERECRELNEAYVKHRRTGFPYVLLKIAATADGKVGLSTRGGARRPYRISAPEQLRMAHALRDQADAILVGIGTVLSDNPRLTTRLAGGRGKSPVRVVLDGRLRIPMGSRVLNGAAPTWIATTVSTRHPNVRRLRRKGVEVLFCQKDRSNLISLPNLLKRLASKNILSLLVEGGPRIWSSFLTEGLVDRIMIFRSHEVLGDRGVPMLATHETLGADH